MPGEERPASGRLNIAELCLGRHAASERADAEAMTFVAPDFSAETFTFARLNELSARFTAALRARGFSPGDRILLRLRNTRHFPAAFFGALRGGFIPVPSSPFLTATELKYLADHCGAVCLVCDDALMPGTWRGNIISTSLWESEVAALAPDFRPEPVTPDTPAYLVYTSGTTGYPKGVLHAHRALVGRLPAASHWFDWGRADTHDRILHSGKFNWTYVLGTGMMDPLYHGKSVVVFEGESSPGAWVEIVRRFDCTTFIGVPTIFRQVLQKTDASSSLLPSLKHAMCAGEHLTESVYEGWLGRFGFPICEGLGMSECSYYISQARGGKMRTGSAGKIQPGHKIELLDENLQPVPPHTEGMLCIRHDDPGLFLGYWNEELPLKSGWFLTGDYASIDEEGHVFFMGRRDDIIKSFGYRISPLEIERVFRDHGDVEEVVAYGEQTDSEKMLVVISVILKAGKTFDPAAMLRWGSERLAPFKLPKKVYQVQSFPRSSNGKVVRSQMRPG